MHKTIRIHRAFKKNLWKKLLPALFFLLTHPMFASAQNEADTFRIALMPMLGGIAGNPGLGFGLNIGVGNLALGVRTLTAAELCIFCTDANSEKQTSGLIGLRGEGGPGTIAVYTGISRVSLVHKDNFVTNGGFFTDPDYTLRTYDGYGIPVELDATLGARAIGIGVSIVGNFNPGGSSGGFFMSLPIGWIHG